MFYKHLQTAIKFWTNKIPYNKRIHKSEAYSLHVNDTRKYKNDYMLQKNCFRNEYLIRISIFHLQTLEWSKQLYSTASSAVSYCKAKFQTFPKLFRTTTKFRKRIFLTFKPIFKNILTNPLMFAWLSFSKIVFKIKRIHVFQHMEKLLFMSQYEYSLQICRVSQSYFKFSTAL